jgi:Tol biopolymer transport system component
MVKRTSTALILLAGALFAFWPSTASAAFPGTDGRIAFTASHSFLEACPPPSVDQQGPAEEEAIFTMNADGSDVRQVTPTQHTGPECDPDFPPPLVRDVDPTFSPSGRRIAFAHRVEDRGDTGARLIKLIRADGTHLHALTGTLGDNRHPAFSPDGKRIAWDHEDPLSGPSGIFLMRSDGTHKHPLTAGADPTFFPNGRRIVFLSGWDIFTVRLDGSHRHRLATISTAPYAPDGSPDGRLIVFARDRGIQFPTAIDVMRADGTHERHLADGFDPVYSPSDRRIAFASAVTCCRSEIRVMRADGSHQHAVTPTPLPFGVSDPSELSLGQPSWGPKP